MTDAAGSVADAIAAFRAEAEAMGVNGQDADELIEKGREAAGIGEMSLAGALHEEPAELAMHLGRVGWL